MSVDLLAQLPNSYKNKIPLIMNQSNKKVRKLGFEIKT